MRLREKCFVFLFLKNVVREKRKATVHSSFTSLRQIASASVDMPDAVLHPVSFFLIFSN